MSHREVRSTDWVGLFSRRVVGWKLDHRMDTVLVIQALNRALGHRLVEPEHLIIHTDQGSQYRASNYQILLEKHEISCSMSTQWWRAFSPPSSWSWTSMTIARS